MGKTAPNEFDNVKNDHEVSANEPLENDQADTVIRFLVGDESGRTIEVVVCERVDGTRTESRIDLTFSNATWAVHFLMTQCRLFFDRLAFWNSSEKE